MSHSPKNDQGKKGTGLWVLLCFIGFFGVVIAVNAVFIVTALNTHSGVITTKHYEKGLAYNQTLEKAEQQPKLNHKASFNNGILKWEIKDLQNTPITATVTVRLVRPVQDGHDFEIALKEVQNGVYEAPLNLPMKGRWDAQLNASWDKNLQFQTRFSFTAK